MKRQMIFGGLIAAAQILGIAGAVAGPWEDGMAAYNRGDYVPAMQVFRALAEQGNAKAQSVLGVMHRRGGRGRAQFGSRLRMVQPRRGARRRQGQGGTARCIANHDTGRTFAGAGDGASLRGLELPAVRVLIKSSFRGASETS
jgi:hypothetical protein